MQISLNKHSEVSLRQQIAQQIVFLITTGQLRPGQQLPSVRAFARRVKVHHNTVSEAYQDLVRRSWVTRQRGSRLIVGANQGSSPQSPSTLDELIDETIQRAKQLGYSVQTLTARVRQRLLAEPADHILVVEEESGLREVICREVQEKLKWPVLSCSLEDLCKQPELAAGAQVFAPNHIMKELRSRVPLVRPAVSIHFCEVDDHLQVIRRLKKPSIVAAASVSQSLLKTARALLAPAIGRRHAFKEFLLSDEKRIELRGVDLAFCDSVAIPKTECRQKIRYRLVAPGSFKDLVLAFQAGRDTEQT